MNIPCVLAITKDSLLGFALTELITTSKDGLVVMDSRANTLEELTREIDSYRADVILLENSNPFAKEEVLARLLMVYPKLLVIIANEHNNWLKTFHRQDILLESSTDLLEVIYSA